MKKLTKNIIYAFLLLIILSGCQNVKDGLTGKKNKNSDEFLVQKKNPLITPPEFKKLPTPQNSKNVEEEEDEIDIQTILGKKSNINKTEPKKEVLNNSIEKSILRKIENN